jgi:predicted P-loop ATPase/GTPase
VADTKPEFAYTVRVSDREFKLITKGLATLSGVKVTTDTEERQAAAQLNHDMVQNRRDMLAEMLRVADGILEKVERDKNGAGGLGS